MTEAMATRLHRRSVPALVVTTLLTTLPRLSSLAITDIRTMLRLGLRSLISLFNRSSRLMDWHHICNLRWDQIRAISATYSPILTRQTAWHQMATITRLTLDKMLRWRDIHLLRLTLSQIKVMRATGIPGTCTRYHLSMPRHHCLTLAWFLIRIMTTQRLIPLVNLRP